MANDMSSKPITVFGGSGFVGRAVVRALVKDGHRVRVAVRRPDLAFDLQPIGAVGQIQFVQANVRFEDSVRRALIGAKGAVNLVGILMAYGNQRFEDVHTQGALRIAQACRDAGLSTLVHVSALGADAKSPALYAKTKGLGEEAVHGALPQAIILRPSLVFGQGDGFFPRFARLASSLPALPLIGGGKTKFQPVYVGDVATVIARAFDAQAPLTQGATYELGGPKIASFAALLRFVCDTIDHHPLLVPMPIPLANLMALSTELAYKASFGLLSADFVTTRDQVLLLHGDNVVSEAAKAQGHTLEGLGIAGSAYEAIVPGYLYAYRKAGAFAQNRTRLQ